MKKIIAIILSALFLSSCTVYKAGMEHARYDPIPNKLPSLKYSFDFLYSQGNAIVNGMNHSLLNSLFNSEITTNIMQKTHEKPLGIIHVECTKVHFKNNPVGAYLGGFTLCALNLLGVPFNAVRVEVSLSISIQTLDGDLIKRYKYTRSGKSVLGLYYGKDSQVLLIEVCRDIMNDFKQDVSRDVASITKALNESQKAGSGNIDYNLLAETIVQKTDVASNKKGSSANGAKPLVRNSDVDINIPVTNTKAENTFVLIIANENYEFIDDVQFALNDGETFKDYCIKTLGIPERQVWLYKNASAGIMAGGVDKMVQAMNIFDNAKAIVYYCGHGIPDEKTGDAYIVPTDGKGTNTATCYSLNKLYKTIADSKATNVTYFMDACFTGANRDGSMLVGARGVAREAKKEVIEGNTIVFSAASGDETAMPYKEKGHGLFTYFLLKKLQETQGNVTYGELAEYINRNVKKEAFLTNEKPQNPVIATSEQMSGSWKTIKLK